MKIEQSITAVTGYGGIEKCPKNESSKRTLSLPDSLIKQLKEFKILQQEFALSLHSQYKARKHNFYTMAGVPLVTVAVRAGHSKTSTTTDVYSHFLKSNDKIAADKINDIFN